MVHTKMPYGIELIDHLVNKPSQKGSALAFALADSMEIMSGKRDRLRLEAYFNNFDFIVQKLVVDKVSELINTEVYKFPEPDIEVSNDLGSTIKVVLYWSDLDLSLTNSVNVYELHTPVFFEVLSHKLYTYFKDKKDKQEYSQLWDSLSSDAKQLFLYEAGHNVSEPMSTRYEFQELLGKGLIKRELLSPLPEKGYQLITWLRKSGTI